MFIAYRLNLKRKKSDSSPFTKSVEITPQESLLNSEITELVKAGENYVDDCEKPIKKAIGEYLTMDGTIDASKLEDDWFLELQNIELIAVVRPYAKDISRKKFEAQWQKTFQHIIHPKRKQKEKKYTKTL